MKIYLVSRIDPIGYDEYDSMVVVANNEDEARHICQNKSYNYQWTTDESKINVEEIGGANIKYTEPEVILASYNPG